MIIGDGSGTGWQDGCGWAMTVIDRTSRDYKQLKGSADGGSVNMAELMPVMHGITWFHATHGAERFKAGLGNLCVHVVTDSQVTATHGTQAADFTQMLPKSNTIFWAAIREYQRLGYSFRFHWMERSTTPLNQAADVVASMARRVALLKPVDTLTNERRLRAQRAVAAGANALNSQTSWSLAIPMLISSIRELLDVTGPEADRMAREIERVQLLDPSTQMPINARELMPGDDGTFHG